jgi:transposase
MDTTLITVVELSLSDWLVAGIVPGVECQPLKKLKTDGNALLTLLNRWRDEAVRSGHKVSRIAAAFEAGRCKVPLDSAVVSAPRFSGCCEFA